MAYWAYALMAGKVWHRSARYQRWAPQVTAAARRNPRAVCCICGRTAGEHPLNASGKLQQWHACHTRAGSMTWQPWLDVEHMPPPGDWLAPGMSRCNIGEGNRARLEPQTPW